MDLIKPKELMKGDTIALISPSAGLASIFPHRLDRAIAFLKKEGYKVKEFSCTRKNNGWESAPDKERAKDVMDAFLDKEVKAIICTIGGNTANKTLKHLDFKKIRENPKIFCGYSDIGVLHYALQKKAGLVTFYGPNAMTQFGENPNPLKYTITYFNKAVVEGKIGEVKASEKWTDEILDWGQKKDLERARELKVNRGFEWLKEGKAEGEIIGGCLPSICNLLGTVYWPDHNKKILFIELPEAQQFDKGMPLAEVDALLCNLEIAGIFKQVKGLIVGRPFRYDDKENEMFKKVITDNTKHYNFPILYGADIGHTDPQITIPIGLKVGINSYKNIFEFL